MMDSRHEERSRFKVCIDEVIIPSMWASTLSHTRLISSADPKAFSFQERMIQPTATWRQAAYNIRIVITSDVREKDPKFVCEEADSSSHDPVWATINKYMAGSGVAEA